MAAIRAPSPSFLSAFLSVVRARLLPQDQAVRHIPLLERIQQLRTRNSLLPAVFLPIPSLLEQLWDGLLKAVPKKKTSHMKKRHRQMAGKALKDATALNKCSACGRTKRAHVLCPYCVQSIKRWFTSGFKSKEEIQEQREREFDEMNDDLITRGKKPLKWEHLYGDVERMKDKKEREKKEKREKTKKEKDEEEGTTGEEQGGPSAQH